MSNYLVAIHNELYNSDMWRILYERMIGAQKLIAKIESRFSINEHAATESALNYILGTLAHNRYITDAETFEHINHNKECLCGLAHYLIDSLDHHEQEINGMSEARRAEIIRDKEELVRRLVVYIEPGGLCHGDNDDVEHEILSPMHYGPLVSSQYNPSNTGSEAAGGKPRKTGKQKKTGKKRKTSKKQRKSRKN